MKAYLAFESALQCWRSPNLPAISMRKSYSIDNAYDPSCTRDEIQWLCSKLGLTSPICSVVTCGNSRRRNKRVSCRVQEDGLAGNHYYPFGKESFLASPELTLAHVACLLKDSSLTPHMQTISAMAPDHTRAIALATIMCEFCGTYRLTNYADGFVAAKRLTSVQKLRDFLTSAGSFKGRRIFEQAVKLALDHSNSPAETACALLASMPKSFGGFGVAEKPSMNYSVSTTSKGRDGNRYGDLCWPDQKVILEYNGSYHEGERANKDDQRRIELMARGFSVASLNSEQLYDAQLLEEALCATLSAVPTAGRKPANFADRRRVARSVIFETSGTRCRENAGCLLPPQIKVLPFS